MGISNGKADIFKDYNKWTVVREYVLLANVLFVLVLYIRYLIKYPDDFSYYYYRINYYQRDPDIDKFEQDDLVQNKKTSTGFFQ